MSKPIYLDHASTSHLRPAAREAIERALDAGLGNPTGQHSLARAAKAMLEGAREKIAALLCVKASEVYFTSSATEANNWALKGVELQAGDEIVVSSIEHKSVLEPARLLARNHGVRLNLLPVGRDGVIRLDVLEDALSQNTALVSVMAVNNEVGTVQPIRQVAAIVKKKAPRAVFHCDAAQALPWLDPTELSGPDWITISSHKLGGPLGAAALIAKMRPPRPLLLGGGQERDMRAGTPNTVAIAGFAAALAEALASKEEESKRVRHLRDWLSEEVLKVCEGVVETVPRGLKVPNNAHFLFKGLDEQELLWMLDEMGLCASAGSSCASGAPEPSHVLKAMGIKEGAAPLRLSLGWSTTFGEVESAVDIIARAHRRLREPVRL